MEINNIINLSTLDLEKGSQFLNSFDELYLDLDGVIFRGTEIINGSIETINKLHGIGKKIYFVSNNGVLLIDQYRQQFTKLLGRNVSDDDFVVPYLVYINYLKNKKFNKTAYVIGSNANREMMVKAGIKVAAETPSYIPESRQAVIEELEDNSEIGAVIVDLDINTTFIKIAKAITYLRRPDVHFLVGITDYKMPLGKNILTVGPGHFINIIETMTNRKPIICGKPGEELKNYLFAKHCINPSKALFVGDSLSQDMMFASMCGFQKVLVLSGVTSLQEVESINDEQMKPHYIANSLKDLLSIIK